MKASASTLLRRLESLKAVYDATSAERKAELVRALGRRRLSRAAEVERLHEALCFLRAYPDDAGVLDRTEAALQAFDRRGDLRRHRNELADSGIAGTRIHFRFFWLTASWLVQRWPERLRIDWEDFDGHESLEKMLHLLVPYSETPALDMLKAPARSWIDGMKGPDETDATFLVRRFEAIDTEPFTREKIYEDLEVPLRIEPGPDTPSRTRGRLAGARIHFQDRPLDGKRPELRRVIHDGPRGVRHLPPRDGARLIDLAREAMVTRSRDLWAFQHADRNDVRLIDFGDGLQFACMGTVPERRLMLETLYGYLTLKNGLPIGYVLSSSLFGSSEVAYNVFDSFRGGEAGYVFGRVMAMVRQLFGSDAFSIDPYQLGHGNPEGLRSGAWWFYYKLGFRPRDADVKRLLRGELNKMKRNSRHRSSLDTLDRLSAEHMYFYLNKPRSDTLGLLSLGEIGQHISGYLAGRFGADREGGIATTSHEAMRLLGVRSTRGWTRGEKLIWDRWSPLVLSLPGVTRWPVAERRALARVVRAKGGRSESDYVKLTDGHRRLRTALVRLATE